MRKLLVDCKCNPNIKDFNNEYYLIDYCLRKRKYQALQLIIENCKDTLDLELTSDDGETIFGLLFSKKFNSYRNIMQSLNKYYASKFDIHKTQVLDEGIMISPICYYIRKIHSDQSDDFDKLISMPPWQSCFLMNGPFEVQTKEEIDQLWNTSKKPVKICVG